MRLAIDASRTTVARTTGTEAYARDLIRALIASNPGHDIALYFRDTPPPDLFPASKRLSLRVIPFRRAWTHLRFAAAIAHDRPDLTFVPAHTLPFAFPGRAAVTVHDLGYKWFPGAHPARSRLYLDLTTRYSAQRASVVFADSRATADDLMRFYGVPSAKIRVVYPGVSLPVRAVPADEIAAGRAKYRLPERYCLFLGTLQPRKNIARLVAAYAQYRAAASDPAALVLAGGRGWLFDPAWTTGDGIIATGYVDDADKAALYAGALAFVFPSLYEGFGFPVLEAMRCGTPVVCSHTSSLPELVGAAALLVDPLNVDALAAGIARLTDLTADERADIVKRGHTQAAQFTWDAAARAVWEGLEDG
ncbi:MAG: glycosyltransferase family 1 protein [Chloroflexota bacterium]|nr:glycosyltransferase family 1 protein [Chloroflexota bacterium]